MRSLKDRISKLESLIRDERISWRTYTGELVGCYPVQLFTAKPGDPLHTQILDADPASFRECPLVEFVRAFLLSEPNEETEKDLQVVEMLTDLGIPFHWDRKGENEKF